MADQIETLVNRFESLMRRVELEVKIKDALTHSDGAATFTALYKDVMEMQDLVSSMRENVKKTKVDMELLKENYESMKSVEKNVDGMLLFALKNSAVCVKREELDNISPENKENSAPKKKTIIAQLNPLTSKEFASVPKYVRSHLSLDQVLAGIAEVNHILHEKYTFLAKPRKLLSVKEDKRRAVYLEQAKEVKGTTYSTFFMDDDIKRYSKSLKLKPKTKDTVFLILRHLGRLKEMHRSKITRYCILTA
ncbi:SKA complex subunit 1-like [Ciona intestinalis]